MFNASEFQQKLLKFKYLLQVAFNDHKEEILNYIETQKSNRKIKFEKVKKIKYCFYTINIKDFIYVHIVLTG